MSKILGAGLPADKGVRPHVSVFADADTVAAAAAHAERQHTQPEHTQSEPASSDETPKRQPVEPATLAGHGHIGPLLMYLFCLADVTAFAMKNGKGLKQDQVLNVGTTRHDPSLKQRRAVIARQQGVCAAPGCKHTHLEVHHTIFWSHGGPTDLDLLIGLCN
ncbi:HNH endonuclease [Aeromicrobium sp. UC242_57]|uniref:HNH endonuclease n=1 Tax=Aeromicrobium sp. UC242_57 TaxID=3374624 RepID=UPI0037A67039